MYSTSTLEAAVIVAIKSETNQTDTIDFRSFGADRKAYVDCRIEDVEYKFCLNPRGEKVHISLETIRGHNPRSRDIPPRKRSMRTNPIDLPTAMKKIVEGEA